MKCPKCPGMMQTYNRAGIHIEQCNQCRGIFLDYGELEQISRAETSYAPPAAAPPPVAPGYPPPAAHGYAQPGWGHHGHHGHHQKSFMHALFST